MKKNILTVLATSPLSEMYLTFLKEMYNVPEVKVKLYGKEGLKEPISSIDLVVLTGGADVDPSKYGEELGKYTSINKKRDNLELSMLSNIYNSIPKLGICRGAQLLTVHSGGKLIQHVEGHHETHNMDTMVGHTQGETPSSYAITSDHHQMMYPFDLPTSKFELLTWSSNFNSTTYLNGDNKESRLKEGFLEPEIVYYKDTNSLCIQGHPEYPETAKSTLNFINYLIKNYLK